MGTFAFVGWSFIGNTLSKLIPTKVSLKQLHTDNTSIIGKKGCLKRNHTNKAPTMKVNIHLSCRCAIIQGESLARNAPCYD